MAMLTRPRFTRRDQTRARARGPRRFERASAPTDTGLPPPDEFGVWPGPDRPPRPDDAQLQWPFWLLLIVPWLLLGASWLLEHMKVCLICLSGNVPIP